MSAGVRTVRIDVPLKTTVLYFFIHPEDRRWGPWWGDFFEFLLTWMPLDAEWARASDQGADLVRRELSEDETALLVENLRTAPEVDRLTHRSLRKALERLPGRRGSLVFFREPLS